jgi:hypothetical protein
MSNPSDFSNIQIESSMPKPWEMERTFNDVLYDWMNRAPYLAIAVFLHLLAFFALNAIPWNQLEKKDQKILQAEAPPPPEEQFEEPEPEPPEEIIEEPIEEPVVSDSEVVEEEVSDVQNEVDSDAPESPFNSDQFNNVIGIGGGAGGGGGKIGGRRKGRAAVGNTINKALLAGLEWLKDHQSEDGSWEAAYFADNCPEERRSRGGDLANGKGEEVHDVGVTSLALLAFLGFGDTIREGNYKDVIRNGIDWLINQQDRDTGLVGPTTSKEYLYDHSIATLALCEALYGDKKNPQLKKAAQKAVEYCLKAQNYGQGWRYSVPPDGQNDTSVTGWMVFALASAKDAGIDVGKKPFEDALYWLDEVTDSTNGRAGYTDRGGDSSRLKSLMDKFPASQTEAMTAVAVLSRVFIRNIQGTDPKKDELILRGGDRMLAMLPEWDKAGGAGGNSNWQEGDGGRTNDMYYWYYGSYAMYQLGDKYWEKWKAAMENAILKNQRTEPPCYDGSWDPGGPWGWSGGRVYSTALMVLCLEVYFRYGRVLGAR